MKMWSWHFISDVHIKEPGDDNERLFLAFLKRSIDEENCEKIFLCGDIFDLMVGNFDEYKVRYQTCFEAMKKVLTSGKDLYFIEGNHDFNIRDLMINEFTKTHTADGRFHFYCDYIHLSKDNMKYYICHGDMIEVDSDGYQIYKKTVTSRFMKNLVDNVFSYDFLETLGRFVSKRSRERGLKAYGQHYNDESVKEKFRRSAIELSKKNDFNVLICGHSHVKDDFKIKEHIRYINNGYAPISKSYIRVDQTEITFQALD
jgi:UDP-2,3-diacylglucosamine hydrolase